MVLTGFTSPSTPNRDKDSQSNYLNFPGFPDIILEKWDLPTTLTGWADYYSSVFHAWSNFIAHRTSDNVSPVDLSVSLIDDLRDKVSKLYAQLQASGQNDSIKHHFDFFLPTIGFVDTFERVIAQEVNIGYIKRPNLSEYNGPSSILEHVLIRNGRDSYINTFVRISNFEDLWRVLPHLPLLYTIPDNSFWQLLKQELSKWGEVIISFPQRLVSFEDYRNMKRWGSDTARWLQNGSNRLVVLVAEPIVGQAMDRIASEMEIDVTVFQQPLVYNNSQRQFQSDPEVAFRVYRNKNQ